MTNQQAKVEFDKMHDALIADGKYQQADTLNLMFLFATDGQFRTKIANLSFAAADRPQWTPKSARQRVGGTIGT